MEPRNIGWPYFNLMNIQEGRLKQQQQRVKVQVWRQHAQCRSPWPSAARALHVPPLLPPAPAFLAPRPIHQGVLQLLSTDISGGTNGVASAVVMTSAVRPSPTLSGAWRLCPSHDSTQHSIRACMPNYPFVLRNA